MQAAELFTRLAQQSFFNDRVSRHCHGGAFADANGSRLITALRVKPGLSGKSRSRRRPGMGGFQTVRFAATCVRISWVTTCLKSGA